MHYSSEELDRSTGELITVSLGDWRTVTEVGRLHGAGPRRTRQVLVHMGFLAPEGSRYRLPLDHVAKGWGKRLKHGSTGRPFDVISPLGQELIGRAWDDTLTDLEADEGGEPEVAEASAALETFVAGRPGGLDTEGRVRWLLDHFPALDTQQVADVVCVSRQLVERYAKRRAAQLDTLKATKVADLPAFTVASKAA